MWFFSLLHGESGGSWRVDPLESSVALVALRKYGVCSLFEDDEEPSAERLGLAARENRVWLPVPFSELSKTSAGTPGSKNVVALGILARLLGLPSETLVRALARRFARKASVLAANPRAVCSPSFQ